MLGDQSYEQCPISVSTLLLFHLELIFTIFVALSRNLLSATFAMNSSDLFLRNLAYNVLASYSLLEFWFFPIPLSLKSLWSLRTYIMNKYVFRELHQRQTTPIILIQGSTQIFPSSPSNLGALQPVQHCHSPSDNYLSSFIKVLSTSQNSTYVLSLQRFLEFVEGNT